MTSALTPKPVSLKDEAIRPPRSLMQDTIQRILHSRSAVVGLIMIGILVLLALLADFIATHHPI